jgi:hypothetical protein
MKSFKNKFCKSSSFTVVVGFRDGFTAFAPTSTNLNNVYRHHHHQRRRRRRRHHHAHLHFILALNLCLTNSLNGKTITD